MILCKSTECRKRENLQNFRIKSTLNNSLKIYVQSALTWPKQVTSVIMIYLCQFKYAPLLQAWSINYNRLLTVRFRNRVIRQMKSIKVNNCAFMQMSSSVIGRVYASVLQSVQSLKYFAKWHRVHVTHQIRIRHNCIRILVVHQETKEIRKLITIYFIVLSHKHRWIEVITLNISACQSLTPPSLLP